ncbi:MAG: DNA polymerase III subunit epsilon [Rhodospirillaceae bacterium]|nr:MAG: DNA polymerase III subunit epsilon [Rhodospirillaceae bacterium]
MREIILDTETTGLNPKTGDRIVEIGCFELMNHMPTGRTYHVYLNPERDMPPEAERVHGLSNAFLADKPIFATIAEEFLAFIADAPLVAHNANFDLGFVNAELERVGRNRLPPDRTIDTVDLARRKFPGAQASLDALCRRFQIDTTHRTKHGALLDAELLARVYLELIGGREPGLTLDSTSGDPTAGPGKTARSAEGGSAPVVRPQRMHEPTPDERELHAAFLATLKDPIWRRENL